MPQYTAGWAGLSDVLAGYEVQGALLEATGGHEQGVLNYLATAGLPIVRVEPRRARAFAQAMGQRAKTDPLDAQVLAELAQVIKTPAYLPPSPQQQALRDLVKRRTEVVAQRDTERRRLLQTRNPVIRASIETSLVCCAQLLAALDRDIAQACRAFGGDQARRLASVTGIGPVSVASLLAFLPELRRLDRRQIAALVDGAPYNADSGRKTGKRRIQG